MNERSSRRQRPKICILTSQYFGWGVYGGFGSMSRKLAESLVLAGYQVSVIVPRRHDQQPLETINGVEVQSFAPTRLAEARQLIRTSQADIFHSQDPTVLTFLAQKLLPQRIHLVTCRDPRGWRDWWIEFRYATRRRRFLIPFNYLTESSFLVKSAVRHAHAVFSPAHFLIPKIQMLYRLSTPPTFLPNLIDVPPTLPSKPQRPTFTFLARWDKRKRPWLFFELAKAFPAYRFIAIGQGSASAEAEEGNRLRSQYQGVRNLEIPGFINRFQEPQRLQQFLSDTWVLVNTAAREGLPLTFLEAAAHGCAILSAVDPDQFASRFGQVAVGNDFATALRQLLANDPLAKGKLAHSYVKQVYETSHALACHEAQYHQFVHSHP
jgi:glycosyltransferase involved in cell wall biosynthesis